MNLLRDDHTRGEYCKHNVKNGMRNTHNMIETKYNIVIVYARKSALEMKRSEVQIIQYHRRHVFAAAHM